MVCTSCGSQNPDSAQFCQACGHQLTSTQSSEPTYAGFWTRFAAAFLDGLLLTAVMIPFWIFVGLTGGAHSNQSALTGVIYLITLTISALYFTRMESGEKSATYGKRWMGLKVLDTNGNRISGGTAFGRWASRFFSYITLYIGFLIQPFTEKKQALHDMMAGTVIVRDAEFRNTSGVVVAIAIIAGLIPIGGILAAIAIPAYQDYTVRAKVVQAEVIGRQASQAVETFYMQSGHVPSTIEETGFSLAPSNGISSVSINPNSGVVQVAFSTTAGYAVSGKSLLMTPAQGVDKAIKWTCSSQDIENKYLSPACRTFK